MTSRNPRFLYNYTSFKNVKRSSTNKHQSSRFHSIRYDNVFIISNHIRSNHVYKNVNTFGITIHLYSTSAISTSTVRTESTRRIIDYRSDTVTKPSKEMLQTVLNVQTGDDVMGEDTTVQQLQVEVATLFGKQFSLFVPSGTMSNLCSITSHCSSDAASEIVLGSQSHLSLWEGGNISTVANVFPRQLTEHSLTGEFDLNIVQSMIRSDNDDHYATTKVICLENTHNEIGGVPLSFEYINKICSIAHEKSIKVHVDGARIWNASIAKNISLDTYCKNVDSISVCLSKGLGAPIGSLLVSDDKEFIRIAKRARKRYGGGMRQVGVVAVMGLYAIQNNIQRLHIDHSNAKRLAQLLVNNGNFILQRNTSVETNIFFVSLPTLTEPEAFSSSLLESKRTKQIAAQQFQQILFNEYGIKMIGGYGVDNTTFRIVTHLNIRNDDIDFTAAAMINTWNQLQKEL
jgi:threonine aldolase